MNKRSINYIVFIALMISTFMGIHGLWGLLFLYWTIPNFYSGHAFLVSDVLKKDDPVLFWGIQSAWIILGSLLLIGDFLGW